MFSELRRYINEKGKRTAALLLSAILLCGMAGCAKEQTGSPEESGGTSVDLSGGSNESGFDIERVRKEIVIKGQTIEIPVKLKDIPKGWKYELDERGEYLRDEQYVAYMYYKGEMMYYAALEQYNKKKPKESIIYNLTVYDSDCSIGGLVPQVTTKQEVENKYGAPTTISSYGTYYYGIVNGENRVGGRINDHSICVKFDDNDIVKSISITYADLSKQYPKK